MAYSPPFPSLRMSEDDYAKYQVCFGTTSGEGRDSPKVKVTGYSKEAKDAIVASNSDGSDYIEVIWDPVDSVVCNNIRVVWLAGTVLH